MGVSCRRHVPVDRYAYVLRPPGRARVSERLLRVCQRPRRGEDHQGVWPLARIRVEEVPRRVASERDAGREGNAGGGMRASRWGGPGKGTGRRVRQGQGHRPGEVAAGGFARGGGGEVFGGWRVAAVGRRKAAGKRRAESGEPSPPTPLPKGEGTKTPIPSPKGEGSKTASPAPGSTPLATHHAPLATHHSRLTPSAAARSG
jgi:hypothetical protein